MAKRGRPRSARKADDAGSVFVRFDATEYVTITAALARQAAGVIGGASITVAAFAREVMLREARAILGQK
jgi:hypothetical protein